MFALSDARRTQFARILLWAALVLFALSLVAPSVSREQNLRLDLWCNAPQWSLGWEFFLIGPLGVLNGQFGWIANPLMLFASLSVTAPGSKTLFGVLARGAVAITAIALIVLTPRSYTSEWHDGGVGITVCGFGLGYYLWLACSIFVLIATLLMSAKR